ncbi:MAG: hypothetical protein JNK37_01090 [Verrucomicrobiales bacterium]|nr:hypothetical protein [Verrucomicrobiales bacterium]
MKDFRPGFRLSLLDAIVLAVGGTAAAFAYPMLPEAAFLTVFVVGHFFLFCNVFRIGRKSELYWAGTFIASAGSTIVFGMPGWIIVAAFSLGLAACFIGWEMRLPSYHGIGWRRLNPGLEEWWRRQSDESATQQ